MEKIIRNKLYKEFIEPTKQRKNFIGIEIEVPIINLNKKPVDLFNLSLYIINKNQD